MTKLADDKIDEKIMKDSEKYILNRFPQPYRDVYELLDENRIKNVLH